MGRRVSRLMNQSKVGSLQRKPNQPFFTIARGDPLSVSAASEMLKAGGASLVVLVGQAEAGKTSLIAEVYDAFQYDAYLSLSFRGSLTLTGFEKICHKVRGASRGSDLSQERTDVTTDPVFYHLALCADKDLPKNVLIADRSGERYREALDRPSLILECVELRRATVLNLLVDWSAPLRHGRKGLRSYGVSPLHASIDVFGSCPSRDATERCADKARPGR